MRRSYVLFKNFAYRDGRAMTPEVCIMVWRVVLKLFLTIVHDHCTIWEILHRCFSLSAAPISSGSRCRSRTRDSVPLDSGRAWDHACCFCRIINKTAFLHRSELRSGAPVCEAELRATGRKSAYRSLCEPLIFKFSPTYLHRLSQSPSREGGCTLLSRAWITLI